MLRFKILASAVPLFIAAIFARGELVPGPRPCIAIGEGSVQIAAVPWQAELHVSFTHDPALATVRVQISDDAATADFEPVIYLSADRPADYRIFVQSKRFSAREAAALIVGASGSHRRIAAASL